MDVLGSLRKGRINAPHSPLAPAPLSASKREARHSRNTSAFPVEADKAYPRAAKENVEPLRMDGPSRRSVKSFFVGKTNAGDESLDTSKTLGTSKSFRVSMAPRSLVNLLSPTERFGEMTENMGSPGSTVLGERTMNESFTSPSKTSLAPGSKVAQSMKDFAVSKREYIKNFRKKFKEDMLGHSVGRSAAVSQDKVVPKSVDNRGESRMSSKHADVELRHSAAIRVPTAKEQKRGAASVGAFNANVASVESPPKATAKGSERSEERDDIPTYFANDGERENFEAHQVFDIAGVSVNTDRLSIVGDNLHPSRSKESVPEAASTRGTPRLKGCASPELLSRGENDVAVAKAFEELRAENAKKDETIRQLQEKVHSMEERFVAIESMFDRNVLASMVEKVDIMKEKVSLKESVTKVDKEIEALVACMKDFEQRHRDAEKEEFVGQFLRSAQQVTSLCQEKRTFIQNQIAAANRLLERNMQGCVTIKKIEEDSNSQLNDKSSDEPCFSFRHFVEAKSMGISDNGTPSLSYTNSPSISRNTLLSDGIRKKMSRTFIRKADEF